MRRATYVVWVGLLIGCERAQTAGPTSQPAGRAQPSAARIEPANPTTQPIERAPTMVYIDQKQYTFPPAILQLRNRDGQLNAVLMSDDPKTAIDDNYHGNSFYLELPLQVADPKDLSSYVYRYEAPSSDRTDSPDGVFLDGNKLQLQPAQMQVKFDGDASSLGLTLSGSFLQFDTRDDTIAPKRVNLVSHMEVEIKNK